MHCFFALLAFIGAMLVIYMCINHDESFDLDHYLRPNYQSGVNMLRGDLPIQPVHHGWFNTRYGPSSLAPGFFAM